MALLASAIVSALHHHPRHLFAVDGVESRLERAKQLGAEPHNSWIHLDETHAQAKEVTDGRGADMIIELLDSRRLSGLLSI